MRNTSSWPRHWANGSGRTATASFMAVSSLASCTSQPKPYTRRAGIAWASSPRCSCTVWIHFPGGIGTLDEWMSTLAVMCIGDEDRRPIIVANLDDIYDSTIQQLADMTRTPFARGKNLTRTLVATTATDLITTLNTFTSH